MAVVTKNRKRVAEKVDIKKSYSLKEATNLVKEISFAKFDSSVDVDIRLGVDPKKSNQMVRSSVILPHGTGKTKRVLVLCTPDKEEEAKSSGADHVGLDEYLDKIQGGWLDIDVIITTPSVMGKLGKLARILGPRNLMPNPKTGTVTNEIAKAVEDVKKGKTDYRIDKNAIIHSSVGRVSFDSSKLEENILELIQSISKNKPSAAKGTYFKSIALSSTMSPGISIDLKSISII